MGRQSVATVSSAMTREYSPPGDLRCLPGSHNRRPRLQRRRADCRDTRGASSVSLLAGLAMGRRGGGRRVDRRHRARGGRGGPDRRPRARPARTAPRPGRSGPRGAARVERGASIHLRRRPVHAGARAGAVHAPGPRDGGCCDRQPRGGGCAARGRAAVPPRDGSGLQSARPAAGGAGDRRHPMRLQDVHRARRRDGVSTR